MVTVRPAEVGDLPGILDIDRQSGRLSSGTTALAAALEDPNRLVVVAESGGEAVGWGKFHTTTFDGGTGLLLRAHRPGWEPAQEPASRRRAL